MSTAPISSGISTVLPRIPVGKELYDELMGVIEQELTSSNVGKLKEKYKYEAPAEAEARAKRYAAAFRAYDIAYVQYVKSLKTAIHTYAHAASQSLENLDRDLDASDLTDLEKQMSQ